MTQDDARERVARGATHLDRVRPDWFRHIDVGTLTLHDPCGCIVGQLVPDTTGKNFKEHAAQLGIQETEACGVNLYTDFDGWQEMLQRLEWDGRAAKLACYQPLQDAWIEAIASRLITPAPTAEARHAEAQSAALVTK